MASSPFFRPIALPLGTLVWPRRWPDYSGSYIRTKDFFLDGFKVGELRPELQYYGLRPARWDASANGEDEEDAV